MTRTFRMYIEGLGETQPGMPQGQANSGDNGFTMAGSGQTQSSPYAQTQSQGNQAARSNMIAPDEHWGFRMFINWYNDSRGDWSQVVQAAKVNPSIMNYVKQAKAAFEQQNTHNPKYQFRGHDMKGMGHIADVLQKAVTRMIPDHGEGRYRPIDQQQRSPQTPPQTGANQSTSQGPNDATMAYVPGQASKPRAGAGIPPQYRSAGNQADAANDVTAVLPMLRSMEDRIASLEAHLGLRKQTGPGAVASAQ